MSRESELLQARQKLRILPDKEDEFLETVTPYVDHLRSIFEDEIFQTLALKHSGFTSAYLLARYLDRLRQRTFEKFAYEWLLKRKDWESQLHGAVQFDLNFGFRYVIEPVITTPKIEWTDALTSNKTRVENLRNENDPLPERLVRRVVVLGADLAEYAFRYYYLASAQFK